MIQYLEGDCREVLDGGAAGMLVAPRDPEALASALIHLLRNEPKRKILAANLHRRIQEHYSSSSTIGKLCDIYDRVLSHTFKLP